MTDRPPVVIRMFACTDVGRTRDHNEDAFVVADLSTVTPLAFPRERTETPSERGTLFMVADGMGGAAAGEIASSMAVDEVLRALRSQWIGAPTDDPTAFAHALLAATTLANDRIHRYASDHPEFRGMGTTATVAGLLGDTLYIAQVGDSRAYLVRRGEARQLTKDQSLMQRLIEAGEITAEEAEVSERRNIILQALGPESAIKVDITHQQLRRGDTLVLCSDGLSGLVRDHEIARAVADYTDLRALCSHLVAEANSRGGPDNITVVVARFEGDALADAAEDDEVGHRVFPVGDETPPGGLPAIAAAGQPAAGTTADPPASAPDPAALVVEPPAAAEPPNTGSPSAPAIETTPGSDRAGPRSLRTITLAVVAMLAAAILAALLVLRPR